MQHPVAGQEEPRIKVWVTREGWIYLVILVFVAAGALLRNINLLMLMTGIMIAPVFLSWRALLTMLRSLKAARIRPQQLFACQTAGVSWKVTNERLRFPSWQLVVQDQIRSDREKQTAKVRVVLSRIRAGETGYGSYQVYFPERGRFLAGPARVLSRFPFGLLSAQFELTEEQEILVAPALGRLKASWDRRLLSHASGSQAIKRQRGSQDEEFFGLRQWRSGDNRRHIHWRATAKNNQLVVKQFDSRSDRDFVLLLDLWAPAEEALIETHRSEIALSFASTVMTSLPNLVRGKVALAICGQETVVLCDLCHPQFCTQVWNELAVARMTRRSEIAAALAQVADQIPGGTPFYVLSTRERPAVWSELFAGEQYAGTLNAIEPWLRWLPIGGSDFRDTFEPPENLRLLEPALQGALHA